MENEKRRGRDWDVIDVVIVAIVRDYELRLEEGLTRGLDLKLGRERPLYSVKKVRFGGRDLESPDLDKWRKYSRADINLTKVSALAPMLTVMPLGP